MPADEILDRLMASTNGAHEDTRRAAIDAHRSQVLAEAAGLLDRIGHAAAAWVVRDMAAAGEKDSATAPTSTPQPEATPIEDWPTVLRIAITDWQGEWTTRRVQKLHKFRFGLGRHRFDARADLKDLLAEGLLVLHDEDPNRVFYTFNSWNGGSR